MQPEDQQQPTEDKQASRGIMRCGQRVGETLADEEAPPFLFGESPFGALLGRDVGAMGGSTASTEIPADQCATKDVDEAA